jgi:hypothetical protein
VDDWVLIKWVVTKFRLSVENDFDSTQLPDSIFMLVAFSKWLGFMQVSYSILNAYIIDPCNFSFNVSFLLDYLFIYIPNYIQAIQIKWNRSNLYTLIFKKHKFTLQVLLKAVEDLMVYVNANLGPPTTNVQVHCHAEEISCFIPFVNLRFLPCHFIIHFFKNL